MVTVERSMVAVEEFCESKVLSRHVSVKWCFFEWGDGIGKVPYPDATVMSRAVMVMLCRVKCCVGNAAL